MEREPGGHVAPALETRWRASQPSIPSWSRAMEAGPSSMRPSPAHRQSLPSRRVPRRSLGWQHELQQPHRRLSSHQLLLLTPFGGSLPPGVLRDDSSAVRSTPTTLGSQPLASIPSASSSGSNDGPQPFPFTAAAVPMTRSNSLPVLSLQELELMRQRDEDHGIVRGGHWAWISKEVDAIAESAEVSPLSENVPKYPSQPAVPSPITAFRNPFLPAFTANPFSIANAHATDENYSFDGSPKTSDAKRRASEATSNSSASTATSPRTSTLKEYVETRERRPSVPVRLQAPGASTPVSPKKPALVRYKSSPSLAAGLGLNINVVTSSDAASASAASSRKQSLKRREGSWASVTVLDGGLEAMSDAVADTHLASRRASIIQLPADFGSLRGTFDLTMEDGETPELDEPKARRGRFESIDSAFPHFGDAGSKVALTRWVDRFSSWPRRGSLAVDVLQTHNRRREASG